jgi:hypothetical protein
MEDEDEIWAGEESVELHGIPEGVWSDSPIDQTPLPPESWVDELADKVEIQRLCAMQVLIPAKQFQGEVTGSLTTKFVRDWRLKQWGEGENSKKRWMRRSRFVAREFAVSKRLDTFSPATGAHTSNLLPLKYLWMKRQAAEMESKEYEVVMASILMFVMHFCRLNRASRYLCICKMNRLLSTETFQDKGWELSSGFFISKRF